MKVKIIKRAERDKNATPDARTDNSAKKSEKRVARATVESWIVELRRKREAENSSSKKFLERQSCEKIGI
ncbi:MAG TPA: hypothetical protein VF556_13905 [Pyrinomonadaceae bacterium]|jgi:hypothetical protein